MSAELPGKPGAQEDSPLESFSHCHEGILTHLGALGELPALAAAATRARELAGQTQRFFAEAMLAHHEEEERELFTAVLASAVAGEEAARVQAMVQRLTEEHRAIEVLWYRLAPQLKRLANGHVEPLDGALAGELVSRYRAHADFEEREFLPLCQLILGRNGSHMAALGLALHMRHAPQKLPYI
ncbi:hemerythrin domain-containing protein [Uliginosibacterium sp. 31-12]|uniref:hemerythrin domain-containing protein n=1 Tax=Uliginosibacterium sp. 31-12 TaxID=3062781 RepID=UPI0026E43D7C|nr:hemerythrin domain-containing protein [Uliginosibacterium sp. 31-12]MDO6385069.1 hemerythrin domain-containing protein [Uliginosibacterium sp. 31-12]